MSSDPDVSLSTFKRLLEELLYHMAGANRTLDKIAVDLKEKRELLEKSESTNLFTYTFVD